MVLNVQRVGADLMWMGSEFHSEGAATEKALSPQVHFLALGSSRRLAELDLRERVGTWRWMSSER